MKIPLKPPTTAELFSRIAKEGNGRRITEIIGMGLKAAADGKYRHWDVLRHRPPPKGLTHEEWWLGIKLARVQILHHVPMVDKDGEPFQHAMPDAALHMVHLIDRDASGRIEISEQVTNPSTRDRYIINSLMEEAITSSQLEGAATTGKDAKKMIRSGRKPTDRSEQMIWNNYQAMRFIRTLTKQPLTPDRVLELHRIVTKDALDDLGAAGRLRTAQDDVCVQDESGQIIHTPPAASELPARLRAMCSFANGSSSERFVHPVIRAIILHFWIGYDHPFVDGNGRTARAIFYWAMLSQGYWLCEYVSISRILRAAPAKYSRSFLYTETDENDLTYFILYQLKVIRRAIDELHAYLERKIAELRQVENLLRQSAALNHRQLALLSHALRHPGARYSIESHRSSHNVVYQTARTDLLNLADKGLLDKQKVGRSYFFDPPENLPELLR